MRFAWRFLLVIAVLTAGSLLAAACGPSSPLIPSTSPTPKISTFTPSPLADPKFVIEHFLIVVNVRPWENYADPSTAKAARMTEQEALEAVKRRGGLQREYPRSLPSDRPDRQVWLVEARGEFSGFGASGHTPGPRRPGTLFAIVTPNGEIIPLDILWDTP